jgi:hypothetical protein
MGSALAHYEGIKAFWETVRRLTLKQSWFQTLVLQGNDDQVVPYKDASLLQAKLCLDRRLDLRERQPSRSVRRNSQRGSLMVISNHFTKALAFVLVSLPDG